MRSRFGWALLACAGLSLVAALHAARLETPTVDEFAHVPAGAAYLARGAHELYLKNPPLMQELVALPVVASGAEVPEVRVRGQGWGPWRYGYAFFQANSARYLDLFFRARCVPIAAVALCAALLFLWARELYGPRIAAVLTSLFLLQPTVIAHGHLATVDAGAMTAMFGAAYALRRALLRRDLWRFAAAGAWLGVAMAVKYTGLLLVPAVLLVLALCRPESPRRALAELALLGVSAWGALEAIMGFRSTFVPLGDFQLHSAFLRGLAAWLPAGLRVPLPAEYLQGFDAVKLDTEQGEFGSYLLGSWSRRGFWYYDLVAVPVKLTLPAVVTVVAGLACWRSAALERRETLLLAVPTGVLVLLMAGFNSVDLGVRYLLPIFPFLFLIAGIALARLPERLAPPLCAALLVWHVGVVALVHPDHLAFFNVAVGGPRGGYRVLADSNLDWGQDLYRLPAVLEELGHEGPIPLLYFGHVPPGLYGIDYTLLPPRPVKALFAVSAHFVVGGAYRVLSPDGRLVPVRRGYVAWLRGLEPVARAGTIWVYDTRVPATQPAGAP